MKRRYYLLIVVFLLLHTVASWFILFLATKIHSLYISFILPVVFGSATGILLLMLFNHDNVIKFAKMIEEHEEKMEKMWLRHFAKTGKLLSAFLIGVLAGPIVGALTIKVLIPRSKYKYLIIVLSNTVSTFFYVFVLKGTVHILF